MKSLHKLISKEFPELKEAESGYFYHTPVSHIVQGFCCEITPSFIRLYENTQPLYDLVFGPHLSFSKRIFERQRQGSIKKNLAWDIIQCMRDYQSTCSGDVTPTDFLKIMDNFQNENPLFLSNPPYLKAYANTLVMLGDIEQARKHLIKLSDLQDVSADIAEDVRGTLDSISKGVEVALSYRMGIESAMLCRIGLK